MQLVSMIMTGLRSSFKTEGLVGKDLGARLLGELSWAVDQLEPVLQGTLSVPVVCNPLGAAVGHPACRDTTARWARRNTGLGFGASMGRGMLTQSSSRSK